MGPLLHLLEVRWQRLSFCNSKSLPQKVNIRDRLWEWVGIGWIDIGGFDPKYPIVVNDE